MGAALSNLAVLRFDQERYEESINLQEQLNDLAVAYVRVGRFDDGDVTYQRAIDICRRTPGEEHIVYGVLLKNYAFVLRKLGHKREAKKLEKEGELIQQAVNRHNGVSSTISLTGLRSDRAVSDPQ